MLSHVQVIDFKFECEMFVFVSYLFFATSRHYTICYVLDSLPLLS